MAVVSDLLDAKIARVAADQQRNITVGQLRRLGATKNMIRTRVARGSLFREFWSVYSVGAPATTPMEKASAGVLACGPHSALGRRSALALWGFIREWPAIPQVLTGGRHQPKGVEVHRCSTLLEHEMIEHHGITTTTAVRTLLDAAPLLDEKELDKVVNEALLSVYVNATHLKNICEEHPNHPGAKLLEPFWNTSDGATRSDWERDLKAFRDEFNFTTMEINTEVGGREVDGWIADARVVVELDGWETHRTRRRFEQDRENDAANLDAEIVTVRITKRRYDTQRSAEAARLHRICARRRKYFETLSRA